MRRRRADRRERGFALLLVIWVVAILSVLAAGFAVATRSESRLARNLLEAAQARALAEAGVARADLALLETDPRRHWRGDGTPHELALDSGTVRIRIEDEAGKIDLNFAPPELLSGLCLELRIDGATCAALVDGVAERRRAVPQPTVGQPLQLQAARFQTPQVFGVGTQSLTQLQVAAFGAVDELSQLQGIDPETVERLRPFVTVYSQNPRIDASVAPREVLLAIPGTNPREVEQLLAARDELDLDPVAAAALPTLSGVDNYVATGQLRIATILATATTDTGARFTRRAIVALTGVANHPVQTLEWRQEFEREAEDVPPAG